MYVSFFHFNLHFLIIQEIYTFNVVVILFLLFSSQTPRNFKLTLVVSVSLLVTANAPYALTCFWLAATGIGSQVML